MQNLSKDKASFLEKYQRKEDPSTIMQEAVHSSLDINNLDDLLNKLEELYKKAHLYV